MIHLDSFLTAFAVERLAPLGSWSSLFEFQLIRVGGDNFLFIKISTQGLHDILIDRFGEEQELRSLVLAELPGRGRTLWTYGFSRREIRMSSLVGLAMRADVGIQPGKFALVGCGGLEDAVISPGHPCSVESVATPSLIKCPKFIARTRGNVASSFLGLFD